MVRAPWGPSHTLRIQDGYHPRWPSGHKLARRVRNGPKSDLFGSVSDTRAKPDFSTRWTCTGNMAEIYEQIRPSIISPQMAVFATNWSEGSETDQNRTNWGLFLTPAQNLIFPQYGIALATWQRFMNKNGVQFVQSPSWK